MSKTRFHSHRTPCASHKAVQSRLVVFSSGYKYTHTNTTLKYLQGTQQNNNTQRAVLTIILPPVRTRVWDDATKTFSAEPQTATNRTSCSDHSRSASSWAHSSVTHHHLHNSNWFAQAKFRESENSTTPSTQLRRVKSGTRRNEVNWSVFTGSLAFQRKREMMAWPDCLCGLWPYCVFPWGHFC